MKNDGQARFRSDETVIGVSSQIIRMLRQFLEPGFDRVEQTFLSAHIEETENSVSCVLNCYDALTSQPMPFTV